MHERLQRDYAWTSRQREVLRLITAGKTNKDISDQLDLSLAGAKWHVSEILSKLNADSREEAAEYWRRYNGVAPRFARVFRGMSAAASLKWAGIAAGASLFVAGIVAAILVFGPTDDGGGAPPSPDAAPSPPVTAAPTTTLAIAPWIWRDGAANDWAWVRVFGTTAYASTGPQYACCDNFSNGPGKVTALDAATGKELWAFPTASQPFPVTVSDGRVAFGTTAGTVFALDASTGKQMWRHDFPGIPFQVVPVGAALVVADADPEAWGPNGIADKTRLAGRIRGLDPATGEPRWEATVGNFTVFVVPAADGLVAAASGHTGQDDVAFLGDDGKQKWRVTLTSISSPPSVANGSVILAGTSLHKLDLATGQRLWLMSPRNGGTFVGPSIQGDTVVSATNTGSIESRSLATGALNGSGEFPDCGFIPLEASPYALACPTTGGFGGGLMRIDLAPQAISLSPVFIPQGRIQSATFAHGQLFYGSTSGSASSPIVGHFQP